MGADSDAGDDHHQARSRHLDVDHASVKSLEETQQSWLLEPQTKKKKKQIDLGCMVCSYKLFTIIFGTLLAASAIVGLSIIIWKFAPKKHHHPPPLDNYTMAFKMALKFFDAQKCKLTLHSICLMPLTDFVRSPLERTLNSQTQSRLSSL